MKTLRVLGVSLVFAATATTVLVAPPAAMAEEVVHYTVKSGDSCASIARHFYGDSRYADLLHEANDIRGPQPHALKEGRILVIPPKPAAPTGPDAKLTAVKNQVQVQNPQPKPGHVNDPLFRGNRVATEAVSSAAVTFRDETQVRLGERTLVVILGDAQRAASVKPEVETSLVTGNLRAWMAKTPATSRVAVATDSAKVRMIGGEAQVSADTKKTTRVAVYGGNSTITASRKTEDVGAGYGSKAELGKVPTPPKPLPPAPVWTKGGSEVLVDRGSGAPDFVAAYDLPDGAGQIRVGSWHVQIARDAAFEDVVVDRTLSSEIKRLEAPSPGPGKYFVRVSAIDDDHFEGPFTRPMGFGVVKIASEPTSTGRRVVLDPPDVHCLRVGNVTLQPVHGPLDLRSNEPLLLRCAPSDAEPTTLVRVD